MARGESTQEIGDTTDAFRRRRVDEAKRTGVDPTYDPGSRAGPFIPSTPLDPTHVQDRRPGRDTRTNVQKWSDITVAIAVDINNALVEARQAAQRNLQDVAQMRLFTVISCTATEAVVSPTDGGTEELTLPVLTKHIASPGDTVLGVWIPGSKTWGIL